MRRRDVLKGGASLIAGLAAESAEALTPHQLTFLGTPLPPPPNGFIYLLGADGAFLKGADGLYLLGVAP